MRLELASFPVKDAKFSRQTKYDKGVLEINKEELVTFVLEDKRIASADLDVAFPDEQTRITFVRDVVEPRVKVSGPGCVFPGILGPVETVGQGRTHRLAGVTVMVSAQYHQTAGGLGGGNSGLVDMWGPGSQMTPYGSLIHIIPILKLIDSVTELEAHSVIQLAAFKVAHRLAETTRDKTPETMEVFELLEADPSLPRVVCNVCFISERLVPHSGVALYGLPIREGLPFLIHPNELLDGIITNDARQGWGIRPQTWGWMNMPVVLDLVKEHGKRLNFLGVIMQRTIFESQLGKQVIAECTSQVARLLRADGAFIVSMGGVGGPFITVQLTVQAYERKGIKTVLLTMEGGGGGELPLSFYVPEGTAMVSMGDVHINVELPAPAKVIGCEKDQLVQWSPDDPLFSPWGDVKLGTLYEIASGPNWWGFMNQMCKEY